VLKLSFLLGGADCRFYLSQRLTARFALLKSAAPIYLLLWGLMEIDILCFGVYGNVAFWSSNEGEIKMA
jgi:hypothetical protein